MPEGSRLMTVPSMVTSGPPAEIIVPATMKPEAFSVIVWPATTTGISVGGAEVGSEGLGREKVLLPMARAPD